MPDFALISRVLNYLRTQRNLTDETIIKWGLGVCPDWQVLAADPEFNNESARSLAEKAGLIRTKENAHTYDFYHHRITIPIHNVQGLLVGFGGRVLPGNDGPKYVNPPESPLYNKSRVLYGLYQAHKNFKKHGGAFLMEGYFDVIKAHQAGFDNAVATGGTAMPEEQAKLLKRFTDTVFIMRDGDKAGQKAIESDIQVLTRHQFKVYVIEIPKRKKLVERTETIDRDLRYHKAQLILASIPDELLWQKINYKFEEKIQDPDDLFSEPMEYVLTVLECYRDGIEYLCEKYLYDGVASGDVSILTDGIEKCVKLLAEIANEDRRAQYIKTILKRHKPVKGEKAPFVAKDFEKPISKLLGRRAQEAKDKEEAELSDKNKLPSWVNRDELMKLGFTQLDHDTASHDMGIYFMGGDYSHIFQSTNFTIVPLFHIIDPSNSRRLVEVSNNFESAVVELPDKALTSQGIFEELLLGKGTYTVNFSFSKKQYILLRNWLAKSPYCYELSTLGWQSEGFFAYTNGVYIPETGDFLPYTDLGIIELKGKFYISMANSRIHKLQRGNNNPYENDLYLKYVKAPISFEEWAHLFYQVYEENGMYGLAFVFISVFKDVITQNAIKIPLLYGVGVKGSGKSDWAESILWLFFSGKNSKKEQMHAYNLSPGQGTNYSFYNRMERFSNCFTLYNEFDEDKIEEWKFGAMKGVYDGEGREVGDATSFKNRKTRIQHVESTVGLLGQNLTIKDGGSVLSRTIPCRFSETRIKSLTQAQRDLSKKLKDFEKEGLSSLVVDLMSKRPQVEKILIEQVSAMRTKILNDTSGRRIETRLVNNYALMMASVHTMIATGIKLPFTFEQFYTKAMDLMIFHNRLLRDNSVVVEFWKTVEAMYDKGLINEMHMKVKVITEITLRVDGVDTRKAFGEPRTVLICRYSSMWGEYAKYQRERNLRAIAEDSIRMAMEEQHSYLGMSPNQYFGFGDKSKNTSGQVFDYAEIEKFGVVLQKDSMPEQLPPVAPVPKAKTEVDPELGFPKAWK